MGKKKKYYKSSKECENIHVFMKTWYGVKSHHRKRTRFHHNDMPIYLLNRGFTPPRSVALSVASKAEPNDYIYVRDDDNNIRCYEDRLKVNKNAILEEREKITEKEQLRRRKNLLNSEGYDYDPCTGEVETIEYLEYLDWLYSVTPTEKVNRQGRQKIKNII